MINKKWVKILQAARVLIENDIANIAGAVRHSNFGLFNFLYKGAKLDLEAEIGVRLEGHGYETFWMWAEHPAVHEQITKDKKWKEYRLAWIDNMIEEFSGVSTTAVGEGVYNEFTTL